MIKATREMCLQCPSFKECDPFRPLPEKFDLRSPVPNFLVEVVSIKQGNTCHVESGIGIELSFEDGFPNTIGTITTILDDAIKYVFPNGGWEQEDKNLVSKKLTKYIHTIIQTMVRMGFLFRSKDDPRCWVLKYMDGNFLTGEMKQENLIV